MQWEVAATTAREIVSETERSETERGTGIETKIRIGIETAAVTVIVIVIVIVIMARIETEAEKEKRAAIRISAEKRKRVETDIATKMIAIGVASETEASGWREGGKECAILALECASDYRCRGCVENRSRSRSRS